MPSILPRGWLWGAVGLTANRTGCWTGQDQVSEAGANSLHSCPAPPLPPSQAPWDPGLHNPVLFLFPRIQKSWLWGKGV